MRKIIGLIIADPNEIHQLNMFNFVVSYSKKGFKVDYFKFKEQDIYVCHSRIGLVNAAIATQHLIDVYKVNQVWNYGAVGATTNLKLHQIVIPNKIYYFDAITPWYKFGQIPQENEYYKNAINNNDSFNLASGQSFIDNNEVVSKIKSNIDVDLFDMEACAIAQTCQKNNIKFYCVKAVSDIIGNDEVKIDDINKSISIASKKALIKAIDLLEYEIQNKK